MLVSVDRLPRSVEEFKSMRSMDFTKPENVCMMLLCALNLYVKDPEAGVETLDLLRGPRPMNGYDVQFLRDRMRGKSYLATAYFEGADPQNGYTPGVPYTLEVMPSPRPQDTEPGYLKVFIRTTGADFPRPVTLRQKGNDWCLWEYSSILTGIRLPEQEDPWK